MATAPAEKLITAEEYEHHSNPGYPDELVRGRIVPLCRPFPRHGQICIKVGRILGNYADEHELGHVVGNDSGVITERNPDTVRGADVAFYSYDRLPRGPLPAKYIPEVPELVFEVRSPNDRWPVLLAKAAEYLEAGVSVVVILDDDRRSAHILTADGPKGMLGPEDELTFPGLLGEFRVRVGRFFE